MGSPSTEVKIPEWLEGAMKPFLQDALGRYSGFAGDASEAVGGDFWRRNPREIAAASAGERRAMREASKLGQAGNRELNHANQLMGRILGGNQFLDQSGNLLTGGEGSSLAKSNRLLDRAGEIAKEQVTGKNLASDPAIAQARAAFSSAMLPMIQNQAAQAGLGRSTALTNAAAAQQAQTLLPLLQGGLAREERGIDRRHADATGRANALFGRDMARAGALEQRGRGDQGMMANVANFRKNVGDTRFNRKLSQIGALQQQGANLRGIRQSRMDSRFNDLMRRFGAYEQSLQGPLGMIGGMMGSQSSKF